MEMDIFNQRAFHQIEMVDALERVPYTPQFLGQLNVFEPRPIRTTTAFFEERDGVISLIQTSARGAPLEQAGKVKPRMRPVSNDRRLAKADRLMADEIQNIRPFGGQSDLMTMQQEVARRWSDLLVDLELTREYHRLGAIQGILLDADGSELFNWFDYWGITQPAEVSFGLHLEATNVRGKCHEISREMQRAAQGAWTPATQIHALCGDQFFDDLIDHQDVADTYKNWADAARLRENLSFRSFFYGGIWFHNYRGTDDESTIAIAADECKFFPVNAPKVFQVVYSPAETFDFVNTPGRPVYPMIIPDRDRNAWVDLEIYSYPLHVCTRPRMLLRARAGA